MPSSLVKVYQRYMLEHKLDLDPAQEELVVQLQDLVEQFASSKEQSFGFLKFWKRKADNSILPKGVYQGVYLWGSVGCGKTLLLNIFFNHLPLKLKRRLHFHEFMRGVHQSLSEVGNISEPLKKIARRYAQEAKVLYLDEFHVIDIGDAMILGRLLEHLLACGVVLLLTSNSPPQQLYKNGLQRERFLPAIRLIDNKLKVFELCSACDYRLKFFTSTRLYNVPADELAERVLEDSFTKISIDEVKEDVRLEINGHCLSARKTAGGVVWFDFEVICGDRRASNDYLEIARCYETVFISGIPVFENRDDNARRFINMIDTFYDRRVRLIASADDTPDKLYLQGRLGDEFCRTASRLIEMQSSAYIGRVHL